LKYIHYRPELARELCDRFDRNMLADSIAGMFLAAPRRTGKSTFLREDLIPEMESRGWLAIYVDLWSDRSRDPAELIIEALKSALQEYEPKLAKLAKGIGLQRVGTTGTHIDLNKSGLADGTTISDILSRLVEKSGKPVALLIDEAQHALVSQGGLDLMFALKAARDHLNQGGNHRLFLVFTGSHRDKLGHLVLNKSQPFFGASIIPFPLLGRDYIDTYTKLVNSHLATGNQFNPESMYRAFELVGHRPELLASIIREVAVDLGEAARLDEMLKEWAEEWRLRVFEEMESNFASLTPIQQAVLRAMSEAGGSFSPFSAKSINVYRRLTGDSDLAANSAQAALDALRDKNLVWKSARGVYALEDESWGEWLRSLD
jgi:hypothetical protein